MKTRAPLQVMQLARIGLVEYRNMALTSRKHADLPSPASPAAAKPMKSDVKAKTSVGSGSTSLTTSSTTAAKAAMGLPCQMDHMYANSHNYGKQANIPNGKSDISEVDHLKTLVLLHLDLAQHQAELLATKDKEIAQLKAENQTLKQRLQRSERRILVPPFVTKSDVLPVASSLSSTPVPTSAESGLSNSIPSAPASSASTDEEILTGTVEDKSNLETVKHRSAKIVTNTEVQLPCTRAEKVAPPRSKSKKLKLAEKITQPAAILINIRVENSDTETPGEEPLVPDLHIKQSTSVSLPSKAPHKTSGDQNSRSPFKRRRLHSQLDSRVKSEPSEVQLKAESPSPVPICINPEHVRIQRLLSEKGPPKESSLVKTDSILTTETPYFTLVGEEQVSDIEDAILDSSEIEVPRWCIKLLPHLSATDGTENLGNDIFLKRHHKHEFDEKRRKRWDLQRIREQRQYEKLRARYEGEDRCQERGIDNRDLRNQDNLGNLSTLWHDPDNASALQIEPWLPVTAFGAPLPALQESEFVLPWVASSTSRSKGVNESSRKRHRR